MAELVSCPRSSDCIETSSHHHLSLPPIMWGLLSPGQMCKCRRTEHFPCLRGCTNVNPLLTNVTGVTILYAGASITKDDEMTPPRCSFLRAL